jgi:hypothetical protein
LRVVTTPNPDGGVTYLFDDVTERLDLERRFDELIRVQRETLDNLAEGVAVFGSDGRAGCTIRLSPACGSCRRNFCRSGRISKPWTPGARPLFDDATWQALREAVTAIENREAICREARTARRQRGRLHDHAAARRRHLVTFHDITDSVNVERALRERNEALETPTRSRSISSTTCPTNCARR